MVFAELHNEKILPCWPMSSTNWTSLNSELGRDALTHKYLPFLKEKPVILESQPSDHTYTEAIDFPFRYFQPNLSCPCCSPQPDFKWISMCREHTV